MDKLDQTERVKIIKLSTDRLEEFLKRSGQEAGQINRLDRAGLLEAMAELKLSKLVETQSDDGDRAEAAVPITTVGGGQADIRWAELELGKSQLRFQEKQLKEQREQLEMQLRIEELKVRSAEKAHSEKVILRRETFEYHREQDKSLVSLMKKYGDATKLALMKMPIEVGELPSYFEKRDRVFESYEVLEFLKTNC